MKQTHTEAISLGYIYNKSMNLVGKENENKKKTFIFIVYSTPDSQWEDFTPFHMYLDVIN